MNVGKWSISANGRLCRCGILPSPARLIYLDDHFLFRNGLTDSCIRPFFPDLDLIEFANGDDADEFIRRQITGNNKIDLIITDILHPGLPGNELVKRVRFYEEKYNSKFRIPIVILSMVPETRFPDLMSDKIIDVYLAKCTEIDDIIMCLEDLLTTN